MNDESTTENHDTETSDAVKVPPPLAPVTLMLRMPFRSADGGIYTSLTFRVPTGDDEQLVMLTHPSVQKVVLTQQSGKGEARTPINYEAITKARNRMYIAVLSGIGESDVGRMAAYDIHRAEELIADFF